MPDDELLDLDLRAIEANLVDALGDSLLQPTKAVLGHPTTGEIEVPEGESDIPGMVWVQSTGVGSSGIEPESSTLDNIGVSPALLKPNLIPQGLLAPGCPLLVKKVNGILTVVDIDHVLAVEFLLGLKPTPKTTVQNAEFDYGLLRPTSPPSLDCLLSTAVYYLGDDAYLVPSLPVTGFQALVDTISMPGKAIGVQVRLNPVSLDVTLTAGSEFTDEATHEGVFQYYPQAGLSTEYTVGWVKLYYNMSAINLNDILPARELLNKGGSGAGGGGLDLVLVDTDYDILIDDDGNIIVEDEVL